MSLSPSLTYSRMMCLDFWGGDIDCFLVYYWQNVTFLLKYLFSAFLDFHFYQKGVNFIAKIPTRKSSHWNIKQHVVTAKWNALYPITSGGSEPSSKRVATLCWNNVQLVSDNCRAVTIIFLLYHVKLLKPTAHVMHQQFNVQQLYALPTLYLCVLYLSENKQRLVPLTA